jgi:hypothetical protein
MAVFCAAATLWIHYDLRVVWPLASVGGALVTLAVAWVVVLLFGTKLSK